MVVAAVEVVAAAVVVVETDLSLLSLDQYHSRHPRGVATAIAITNRLRWRRLALLSANTTVGSSVGFPLQLIPTAVTFRLSTAWASEAAIHRQQMLLSFWQCSWRMTFAPGPESRPHIVQCNSGTIPGLPVRQLSRSSVETDRLPSCLLLLELSQLAGLLPAQFRPDIQSLVL